MRKAFFSKCTSGGDHDRRRPDAPRTDATGTGQGFRVSAADLAITYSTEETKVTPGTSDKFWLQGGSFDAAITFFHGLGAAANFSAGHVGRFAPNVNLDKIAFMAGPRCTFHAGAKHESRLFVESLFGEAHARDGAFPTATDVTSGADSFSLQVGGGWDVSISRDAAIRLFEADYVRTSLPNNDTGVQDHLRLAFGVTYHIRTH